MRKILSDKERKERRREWDRKNKKIYRARHPEKVKAANKKYNKENKELLHRIRDNYRTNHPEWKLLHIVKARAKRLGIEFSLSLEDIQIPEYCPFLGIKLTNLLGNGKADSNISLDRINPSFGYVKGNVQVISEMANRMKNNASAEQLITFAKRVLEIYEKLQ
jgi:hypothetical protein